MVRIIEALGPVDEVEMHLQTLAVVVATGVDQMYRPDVEAFQKRVSMLCLALADGARGLRKQRIVEIRANGRSVVVLNAALDQEVAHLGALQESLDLKSGIFRADGCDIRRQARPIRLQRRRLAPGGWGAEDGHHRVAQRRAALLRQCFRVSLPAPDEIENGCHDDEQNDESAERQLTAAARNGVE